MEIREKEQKKVADTFIEELAERIYAEYPDSSGDICVIFPNRRAGLFFRKYFGKNLGKPVWSPGILSIRDFITEQSGFADTDRLTLLFRLYEVFRKHIKGSETFDRFFSWGEMLLKDFDELDKYLVDVDHLFHQLQDQKNMENRFNYLEPEQVEALKYFWESINSSRLSGEKKAFQDMWDILARVYFDFKQELRKNNLCYDGMASRELAENSGKLQSSYRQIIFAGFNSLNRCEEKIFRVLTENNQARIYWDADSYYMGEGQEAGYYIRKYHALFSNSFVIEQNAFSSGDKNITAIGVPLQVGQAKAMGQLLTEKQGGWDMERTAVVLPDERLLLPVLSSLPSSVEHVNITMGYPLRNTSLFTLFESIIELHASSGLHEGRFYHKPVRDIITHPYIFYQDYQRNSRFINEVLKSNTVFFSSGELGAEGLPSVYKSLFTAVDTVERAISYFREVLMHIHGSFREDRGDHVLEREYIYHFYVQLKRLGEIIEGIPETISLGTFWKLFRRLIEGMNIPFSGEPLRGLQVMGTLETRGLDFENLFILSMNEGTIPPAPSSGSFVPLSLRKAFGLPASEHDDRINAYYFYRLIQRSKNIFLLYNTEAGDKGGGEKSRFLHQLIMESGLTVKELVLNNEVSIRSSDPVTVFKSPLVMEMMDSFLTESAASYRLSPSAVSAYLDCRLKFYFRYVARLYEQEEMKEQVDAAIFGDILHAVMEELYGSLILRKQGNRVEKEDFAMLKAMVLDESFLLKAFRRHFKFSQFKIEGRNLLVKEVIKKLALKILELDEAYSPFEILGLETDGKGKEQAFTFDLPFIREGREVKIGLKGKIDRIDKKDGKVRIIDYKSGTVSRTFSEISALFSSDPAEQNKTVNQALFYAMLFGERYPGQDFTVGIYSTKEIFQQGFSSYLVQKREKTAEELVSISAELMQEYKSRLTRLFTELFNPNEPFDQTRETKTCINCSYNRICGR